jgi:uncharacterized protein (TIGR03546 family)
MAAYLVALLLRVIGSLVACRAPTELAAGFTLGMVIGLLPKGNLVALSLCVLLFSLRVNKGLGLAAAVLFSCATMWVAPFAHKLGLAVLKADSLQLTYACVYNMPLGPWLDFHNSVTTGSLLVGLYLAYPVYWISREIATRYTPGAEL